MGLWLAKPECGVPLKHYVNGRGGDAVAHACGRVGSLYWFGFAMAITFMLTLGVLFVRNRARRRVIAWYWTMFPLTAALIALLFGVPISTARMRALRASWETSEVPKPKWLEWDRADVRAKVSSFGPATIIGGAALLPHYV